MEPPMKIGLTGLPGVGKTDTVMRIVRMLEEEEYTSGGMITKAIMEEGERVGFTVENIITGEVRTFAHINIDSRHKVGKYGVDLKALEEVGVAAIREAMEEADIIVIDEVGRMEVESSLFVQTVEDALDCGKPVIITLHKKSRNPLLQDIRRRDDIRILEVTLVNKNMLPYKVVELIKGETI
ncbi:MAG: NTPase [Thermoplasmata archaeon]|nr:NTPase [Thermoplasmata archaeon]